MFLCFDESGDWGSNTERYYIIGGYLTNNISRIKVAMRRVLKKVRKEFPQLRVLEEIKAADCPAVAKDYILRKLVKEDIKIFYIVIDKKHVPEKNRLGIAQNRFYNYQMGILVKFIVKKCFFSTYRCLIDESSIKVGSLNSFGDYINIELSFKENLDTEIFVKYGLSKNYYEIQAADFICNAFWTKENYPQTDYFSPLIIPKLEGRLIFPICNFGK